MTVEKGFKHSLLGYIPKDWEIKTFGDKLSGFSSGSTPTRTRPDFFSGEILWITSGELNYNIINDTKEKITLEAAKLTNLKILQPGTFLMAITGLEAEGTRGSCAIVGKEATTNQSCMALIPKADLDLKYFFQYYCYYGNQFAFKYCQGTKQQSYNSVTASMLPLILPPLFEQQRISKLLTSWDEAISKINHLITQNELRKKWLMQQLLTGKKRLKGFNEDWEFIRFNEIYSPLKEKAKTVKYKVLSVTKDGIVAQSEYFKKEIASVDTSPYLVIRKGNMVMSGLNFWMGSIDVLTQFKVGMVSPAYKTFEVINPNISEDFMIFFVRSMVMREALIGSSIQGASIVRRNLDIETLEEWDFHLPSLVEQIAIANVLQTSDIEIELLKIKVAKLIQQKKGLMQVLLTGKKRLKVNVHE